MSIEQPTYNVVDRVKGVELRYYDEYWVAECRVRNVSDLQDASSRAFGRLFNYISGDNSTGQKIAMTSPVQQIPSDGDWLVSFVVPKDVSLASIPVPANSSIQLRKNPAGRYAALQYSGLWNDKKFAAKSAELMSAVLAAGLQTDGPVSSAVYNPPFIPPFLRRNEVLIRLKTQETF